MTEKADVLGIVQARYNSMRLKGKVARDFNGMPMIEFLLRNVARSKLMDKVVVATTTRDDDDKVERICRDACFDVFRGDVDDVLGRYCGCLDRWPADTVVRITGDNPLTDPFIIDATVAEHLRTGADYTVPSGLPLGIFGEIVQSESLRMADRECKDMSMREHVTLYLYKPPAKCNVQFFRHDFPEIFQGKRVTVDTLEEFEKVERIAAPRIADPDISIEELLARGFRYESKGSK